MADISRELNGKRVLLVEGEPWTRDSLSLFLRLEGCGAHVAASATEAMAALSSGGFDLIICEYWLPDMDGLSFLKICEDGHPGAVKILTSAYLPAQAIDEARWAGINDVIRQPLTVDMLGRALSWNRTPHAVQGEVFPGRTGTESETPAAKKNARGGRTMTSRILGLSENTERVLDWARAQERNETVREIWKALCDRFGVSTTATGEGVLRLLRKAGSPDVADIFRDEPAPYPEVCRYIAEKLRSMFDDAERTKKDILACEKYVLKRMDISEDDLERLCSAIRDRGMSVANEAGAAKTIRYAAVGGVAVAAARMAPEIDADVEDQVAKLVLAGILVAVEISLAELTLIGITVPAYRKAIPGMTYVALLRELRAADSAFRASAAKKPSERTRRHPGRQGQRRVCRGPYAVRNRGDYHPGIPAGQAAALRTPPNDPAAVR